MTRRDDKSALQWEIERHDPPRDPQPSDNQLGMAALLAALLIGAIVGLVLRWAI